VLEHIGVGAEHLVQMLFREGREIQRPVVVGRGIVACAGARHDLVELRRRRLLRPAEHQVLEEVRVPGLAGLDLVARSGLHRNLHGHQVGKPGRHDDDLQAVGKRPLGRAERQDVVRRGA
jgi:hypothetical protein